MRKNSRRWRLCFPALLFVVFMVILCVVGGALGGTVFGKARPQAEGVAGVPVTGESDTTAPESAPSPITCVVIDAGHGGEDGGASSATGLVEKDVNLAVAFELQTFFEAAGIPVVMTRTEDKLLYDRSVDYQGRKKVLDLAARQLVAEDTPGCLFISIHMNAFPQTQYSGMQVWHSPNDPRSADIAAAIQAGSKTLMPDNHRSIKAAGSNIYLLHHITSPAVLVECGFLSNPGEAARLEEAAYQRALAKVIFDGVMGTKVVTVPEPRCCPWD